MPRKRTATFGLQENHAAALSYVLGFITGIIFYAAEERNTFVRFHAMQSIIFSLALFALTYAVSIILAPIPFIGMLAWSTNGLLRLAWLIITIILIIKAINGERYRLPVAGDIAAQYSRRR